MPLYEYSCDCGKRFEAVQKMADRVSATCACGEQARQVISAVRCKLDGTDPDFPGEYLRWARVRKQHMAVLKKREEG